MSRSKIRVLPSRDTVDFISVRGAFRSERSALAAARKAETVEGFETVVVAVPESRGADACWLVGRVPVEPRMYSVGGRGGLTLAQADALVRLDSLISGLRLLSGCLPANRAFLSPIYSERYVDAAWSDLAHGVAS